MSIDVMNMMIPDISKKPVHNSAHLHVAGRFKRCMFIAPFYVVAKLCARKIMLRVKQIGSEGECNKERKEKGKKERLDSKKPENQKSCCEMQHKSDERIVMFSRCIYERTRTHAENKNRDISK